MSVQVTQQAQAWIPQSEATTSGIRVKTEVMFVPEQSIPHTNVHFFAYRISIENQSDEPVQLTDRHWIVSDGNGVTYHVDGEGVVGEQPHLNPGDGFQYSSACPLNTPFGTMEGSFDMRRADGSSFPVEVALFALSKPGSAN